MFEVKRSDTMKASHIRQPLEFAGDDRWELVNRILQSRHFVSSARLRDFLVHVTVCALRRVPEEATEQQVGILVFQRPPGFNTSEDSIVRSQARLLRMKLAAYFDSEGAFEEMGVEIPKGGYLPRFSKRARHPTGPLTIDGETGSTAGAVRGRGAMHGPQLISRRERGESSIAPMRIASKPHLSASRVEEAGPLEIFWGSIFRGPRPMVIFSNEPFVGSYDAGMRYAKADARIKSDGPIHDHLTGVGEVQSIFCITKLFERRELDFVLKRSALVPWDDAKQTNLIFIGSTAENPALRVLPAAEHFHLTPGAEAIINRSPFADEPNEFRRSDHPITRDFAILSMGAGLTPSRNALVFAGLTTLGTQAAVEYACNPEALTELLRKVFKNGSVRPFEAILEVGITGGVPLHTQLVALRVL